MTIHPLYNKPYVLWQTCKQEGTVPEQAIAMSVDSSSPGLIVLRQENNEILVNPESIEELIRFLRVLQKAAP